MKKHKFLSMLVSASMVYSVFPAMPMLAREAGTGSDDLNAADAIKSDVEKTKFTHMEWTGKKYDDPDGNRQNAEDVTAVNREAASAPIIPYQSDAAAQKAVWNYNAREESTRFQMLTGEGEDWELTVVQNEEEANKMMAEDHAFFSPDFKKGADETWKDVTLPTSWTSQGFDFSIYTNTQMPWQNKYDSGVNCPEAPVNYNPVGLYRKTFTVDESMRGADRRIYIDFRGVESAYYLYVNGHEVGYSEDTFSPHKFDITDYVNMDGENLLAVKVHKFCDGTWFEDQDMIYDGGIYRDVYLTSAPLVQIQDFHYTTDFDSSYTNSILDIEADIRNLSSTDHKGWTLEAAAYDREGNVLFSGEEVAVPEIKSTKTGTVKMTTLVKNPKLWSAENPNLYAMVLTLKDGNGKEVEKVSTQLGFRKVEFTRTEVDSNYRVTTKKWDPVRINGKRLLLKGANLHTTDPIHGKTVPQATLETDVRLMKQNNLNAIRTSHYSNDDYLYWLANDWGMYLMGETNMESHNIMNDSTKQSWFYELGMDRTETAFKRLRNNPSIVIWSIGNEMHYSSDPNFAGGLQRDMVWYFKNNDRTRPVHSEGWDGNIGTDMRSNMYPSVGTTWDRAGSGKMPYVICEYVHGMGNSVGNLKEYWDAIRSADNQMGAFIWDWVDQSRVVDLTDLGSAYAIEDAKGIAGTASGKDSDWNDNAGEGSLNGGHSFSSYASFADDAANFNDVLSGSNRTFTLEAIVKPAGVSGHDCIIAKGDDQVTLKMNSSGTQFEFNVKSGSSWHTLNASIPSDWVGNWHQIAATYDKGAAKIYIDGKEVASGNIGNAIDATTNPFQFGVDSSKGRYFNGEISIGRLYNKALSADEVKGQYAAEPAIASSDESVVLWMDYADGHGAAEVDAWDYYSQDYAQTNLYKDEIKGKFYGYGGDWGDRPNDNSFCENGIVSPDRNPQPELMEVKNQYKNFWFSAEIDDLDARKVNVYNESNFTNLNDFDVTWEVLENGKVINSGTVKDIDVAPQTDGTINVPFEMPENVKAGADYFLNIFVNTKQEEKWAEKGFALCWDQIRIPAQVEQKAQAEVTDPSTVAEDDAKYTVTGKNYSFEISKTTGLMTNYVFNDKVMLEKGPTPDFWRGTMENDKGGFDWNWWNGGFECNVQSIDKSTDDEGHDVITAHILLPNAKNTKLDMVYTIMGDGALKTKMTVDARGTGMGEYLRIGSKLTTAPGYENVKWYGNGPVESLSDRKTFARQGIYESTVNELFYPYLKVDDTGTMTDSNWMALSGEGKDTLLVVATTPLEMQALHFDAEDFNNVDHIYGLKPHAQTYVNVNFGSRGTGGATCGPDTLNEYRLWNDKAYTWEYTILPVAGSEMNADTLGDRASEFRTVESFDRSEYDKEAAAALIERVDSFVPMSYDQLADAEDLYNTLKNMPKAQADIVNADKNRTELVKGYIETIKGFEGKEVVLIDKSSNKLDVALGDQASIVKAGDNNAIRGTVTIGHSDVLNDVLEQDKSWSIATEITPRSWMEYNMIAGKGDNTFAIRTRNANGKYYYDFHIKDSSSWRSIEAQIPAEEVDSVLNNSHLFLAVFNAEDNKIQLYVDGTLRGEKALSDGAHPMGTGYDLTLGKCPSSGRGSSTDIANFKIFSEALTPETLAEKTADGETTELWIAADDAEHRDAVQVTDVTLTSEADEVTAGKRMSFTLTNNSEGAKINSVDWTVTDENGKDVENAMISGSLTGAELITTTKLPNGTKLVVTAGNINGNADVKASKTITVINDVETAPVLDDLGPNNLDTVLPDTAKLVDKNGEQTMAGWMTLNDSNTIVTDAITSGESFTVSSRIFVPASLKDTSTGTWDGSDKHNMIVSLGDDCFAFRLNTNSGANMWLQTYIYTGSNQWNQLNSTQLTDEFLDAWHELSMSYDKDAQTLELFIDGVSVGSKAAPKAPAGSSKALEIGWMSDKANRRNELNFSNVKVFNKAMNAEEVAKVAAGTSALTDEDVLVWLDFAGYGSERAELDALLDEVKDLAEADYTAETWAAFADAKAAAESLNAKYATAKNIKVAKDALAAAKEALVKDTETPVTVDKMILETVVNFSKALDMTLFKEEGKEAFLAALEAAKAELANPTDQDSVDANADALNDAALDLRLIPNEDAIKALLGE